MSETKEERHAVIRKYFQFIDDKDPRIMDLYTDDVELFFPKFGYGKGKKDMELFSQRMSKMLNSLTHDIENLIFIDSGQTVVVEGREWGLMSDDSPFPDGVVSQGRFCNVFRFRGSLICSVHIYTDPDFPSRDLERIMALRYGS
jgi:ketosteroid isomerase-like protein